MIVPCPLMYDPLTIIKQVTWHCFQIPRSTNGGLRDSAALIPLLTILAKSEGNQCISYDFFHCQESTRPGGVWHHTNGRYLALLLAGIFLSGVMVFWQPNSELISSYTFLFGDWSVLGISEWLVMGLLAALVVAIGMGLAGAYQSAAPSTVATFDYSYLIFVALWDYLFFSITPTVNTVTGILLIIAAGILAVRRR